MQIDLQRELGGQYLRISAGRDELGHDSGHTDFREQMIVHNRIDGLLNFEIIRENDSKILEYNVSGLEAFGELCTRKHPGRDKLAAVLDGIISIISSGKDYMLSENDYVVRPETIFTDSEGAVRIPYFSGYDHNLREQLRELVEYLMNSLEYKDEGAVLLIYNFYMRTKDESCTLQDLQAMVKETEVPCAKTDSFVEYQRSARRQGSFDASTESGAEYAEQPSDIETPQAVPAVTTTAADAQEWQWEGTPGGSLSNSYHDPRPGEIFAQSPTPMKVLSVLFPAAGILTVVILFKSGVLINPDTGSNSVIRVFLTCLVALGLCIGSERIMWRSFKKNLVAKLQSAVMREDEATVLLFGDEDAESRFSLVSDEFPTITVTGFPFYIGSKKDRYVDYELKVAGVSKYHLKIDREAGEIYVSDLNSTNGTFVNGIRLKPHVPVRVQRGYELRIAGCVFYCN